MAYIPSSGSVVAFQSDPTKLVGTMSVVGNLSVLGTVPVTQVTSPWVVQLSSGSVVTTGGNSSVQVVGVMPTQSVMTIPGIGVLGSVATLQGTNPWFVQLTSGSVITTVGNSSVTLQPSNNVIGSVAALQGTNPWIVQLSSGSVITAGGNSSVQVVGTMPPQSVSGVGTFNVDPQGAGSMITKLINSSVTAYQGVTPWLANGSVITNNILTGNSSVQVISGIGVIGSVATLQGTNPWVIGNTSVLLLPGLNVIGSVAVLQGTNPWVTGFGLSPSIVGTYAEDAPHVTNDKGVFALQVRNDTMASITSNDGDYSPQAVGPAGEVIIANSPITKWFSQTASVMYGVSVLTVSAPGASVFTYVTGIHLVNESPNLSRVTITQGLGKVPSSVVAFAIAPASGGTNMTFPNALRVLDNNSISASISGVSSVYITIEGFNSKI